MGCGSSKPHVEEVEYRVSQICNQEINHDKNKTSRKSTDTMYFKLHALPRQYTDEPNRGRRGRSEFPHYIAEDMIQRAPLPSHNKMKGRRPHAHYDIEGQFKTERAGLQPLEGARQLPGKERPVLWAYPATYYNYEGQNTHGRHRKGRDLSPGPHRIITDKNKNIQGMVTHPVGDDVGFVRAPERVRMVQRRTPRR